MSWFTSKPKEPSRDLLAAQAELESADRRLAEARETRNVSAAVKVSLQELRAQDYFTPTIFPREVR